jgi:predicted RNA binding protein YcfA (HicA-like mRNA interferase family)
MPPAGSHARYKSACGKCVTTVPMHSGDIKRGTLGGIEKDMPPCYGKGWLTS